MITVPIHESEQIMIFIPNFTPSGAIIRNSTRRSEFGINITSCGENDNEIARGTAEC